MSRSTGSSASTTDRMLWRGPSPSLRARQQRPTAGGPRGGPPAKDKARKVGKGGSTPAPRYEAKSASTVGAVESGGLQPSGMGAAGETVRPAEATSQVCPQHSPVKGYADTLASPHLISAKEGSPRGGSLPVTGSPPPPEQTVEPGRTETGTSP